MYCLLYWMTRWRWEGCSHLAEGAVVTLCNLIVWQISANVGVWVRSIMQESWVSRLDVRLRAMPGEPTVTSCMENRHMQKAVELQNWELSGQNQARSQLLPTSPIYFSHWPAWKSGSQFKSNGWKFQDASDFLRISIFRGASRLTLLLFRHTWAQWWLSCSLAGWISLLCHWGLLPWKGILPVLSLL